ncbi:hypothetical protein BBK36DRAFT_1174910 [Trichoderma citrinoviride]|uniref:Uncharacterized protein n=1 Tax=Trichoderma citrinoviride TaxID=58853 RepID=A0A2T4BMR5_9HYPO|nr:hypothetical protein BBK36DRAFT_1174910 [Trichoderma citrinoviride]PTB70615.1 hypothetical protein BBK36DRAFT_1174910 [Trichoderma citrinoviride]
MYKASLAAAHRRRLRACDITGAEQRHQMRRCTRDGSECFPGCDLYAVNQAKLREDAMRVTMRDMRTNHYLSSTTSLLGLTPGPGIGRYLQMAAPGAWKLIRGARRRSDERKYYGKVHGYSS